jgi:Ca2+-binding RTX toxin-like protein
MITKTSHPTHRIQAGAGLPTLVGLALIAASIAQAQPQPQNDLLAPKVPDDIAVPAGNKVIAHGFARGAQVYTWNGSSWGAAVPDAILFDDNGNIVANHFAGPTWQSPDGSKVVGALPPKSVTVDPDSIPWLLLSALSTTGPGVFADTSFIHRVNTTGGKSPSTNGTVVGQVARTPYTADYFFYEVTKPSIQSIAASPNPLVTGQSFTITVAASRNVTRASANIEFRPAKAISLEIPLAKQGSNWTGSVLIPVDLDLRRTERIRARVRVEVFDAAQHRASGQLDVPVEVVSLSAVLANGVLTVTGDDHNNSLTVGRDAAGTIIVNGGAVPVTGDVATVTNTTLIRILGLGGNDTLLVDDLNGPMPPANLLGGDGDDTLTGSANADELDGGPGNDSLFGRDGDDRLLGGPGNDTLVGGRGADPHLGGEGDDLIVWNPGDGSDVVEGEDGQDTMLFVGANINDIVDVSPAGQRLRFFRNPGNITMDCDGIERVIFQALGGADRVNVNDLTGTQVTNVVVDLSNSEGVGDGLADVVFVNGTDTNDVIVVSGSTNGVTVLGLTAAVTVVGEQDKDELTIDAGAGVDVVDASAVEAGAINLTLNGGPGDDTLTGGAGNDLLIGAQGTDVMIGGAGDDTALWNPGDGSDVVEGQAGHDTMLFVGSNGGESVDISANGRRVRFFRNPGTITMDCNEVEALQFNAAGGPDAITVNDLTGTGVVQVDLDLANPSTSGAGDILADTVTVNGSNGNDAVTITGTQGTRTGLSVLGLSAIVNIVGSDPTLDQLILQLLGGDDALIATDLPDGVIKLTADGGPGDDVLVGSAGADTLLGGEDDDVLTGGPGLDTLDGGPGDNVVIQD